MEVRIKFFISEYLLRYILQLPHIIFPNHVFKGYFKEQLHSQTQYVYKTTQKSTQGNKTYQTSDMHLNPGILMYVYISYS